MLDLKRFAFADIRYTLFFLMTFFGLNTAVSTRTTQLLTTYTDIMTMLSKKCVYWDQLLTVAEGGGTDGTQEAAPLPPAKDLD